MKVVYFSTEWCGPCKTFKPIMQTVSQELGIPVNYVNADYESELVEKYNITSVPTIMVVGSEGNVLFRNSGVMSRDQLSRTLATFK
jgi:thioredoxin 1